jgi:hypothetical protein
MSFEKMLNDRAEYRSFLGDGADKGYEAEYESYELSSVMIRERVAADKENRRDDGAVLYFFPNVSECFDKNSASVSLPEYKAGDLCAIQTANGGVRIMRVKEAEYFDDISDTLSHIRLKLV